MYSEGAIIANPRLQYAEENRYRILHLQGSCYQCGAFRDVLRHISGPYDKGESFAGLSQEDKGESEG